MHHDLFAGPADLAAVTRVLRTVLERPDLEPHLQTPLEDISGWDSMRQVAVVVELEARSGLTLEPAEVEAVHTVGDLVRLIGAKRALDGV
jgi:acyl carrier protein